MYYYVLYYTKLLILANG